MGLRVLVFVDYYLPGYKGGGPVRSVSRIVQKLAGEMDFWIFTRDRDLGDSLPYEGVEIGHWHERFFYAAPHQLSMRGILDAIRAANPQVIYLNSYFSKMTRAVLCLRAFGFLKGIAVIVAPRGEFSPGALQLKSAKKRTYLRMASAFGLHRKLNWQVSTDHERADTAAAIRSEPVCNVSAPDVAFPLDGEPSVQRPIKMPGAASFAFISRISPKKNLLRAIELLGSAKGEVELAIYGPAEDGEYLERCKAAIAALPPNVRCSFEGPIPQSDVHSKLSQHHFFLFPTLGENFGHVIAEALAAGCPALLSDQTPWLDLREEKAGWVIPLNDAATWQDAIQSCVAMDREAFEPMSTAARACVTAMAEASADAEPARRMFLDAHAFQSIKAA